MLGGYGFQDQVTAGDGTKRAKWEHRPELAVFFLAFRHTLIEELVLYLCDNQSLLKAITRWIGEGGKAPLVGSPDVDILAAAIEILRKRIAAAQWGKQTYYRPATG